MSAVKSIAIVSVVAGATALTTYTFTRDRFKTMVATGITSIATILTQMLARG